MSYTFNAQQCRNYEFSSQREWLLTNGLGGYSMGTVSGANLRKYHGHLVAAIKPPTHRMVLLSNIEAFIRSEGHAIGISSNQYPGTINPEGYQLIESFVANHSVTWQYRAGSMEVAKQIGMHMGENSVTTRYTNTGHRTFQLILRPLVCHKFYHNNFYSNNSYPEVLAFEPDHTKIEQDKVPLYLFHKGAQCIPSGGWYYRFEYLRELERGLDYRDDLFSPCELIFELQPGESADLIASTLKHPSRFDFEKKRPTALKPLEKLKEAANKFFVRCEERSTLIAGYPWFTDWGRDTMISLPGLCLCTGREKIAKQIILDYASQMKQGLIPNRFADRGEEPEYNTVDGTLWFVHAMHQTLLASWDEEFALKCMAILEEIFKWHQKGTLYGIVVDQKDGLLTQGVPGVQLTWMDAKIGDWVVTPRYGKPIEINGLWINAVRVMEWLAQKLGKDSKMYQEAAQLAEANFELKFWKEKLGYYLDTADPDDASLRPNQVIAMSLPFAPAKGENAKTALQKITRELLTTVGLRSLAPTAASYTPYYKGSLKELDAAYHQGTVWPWLIGPYISALIKLTGDKAEAKRILRPVKEWLVEYGIGGIAEVYDGESPRHPGGCPWQAWSVAEVLRAWIEVNGEE